MKLRVTVDLTCALEDKSAFEYQVDLWEKDAFKYGDHFVQKNGTSVNGVILETLSGIQDGDEALSRDWEFILIVIHNCTRDGYAQCQKFPLGHAPYTEHALERDLKAALSVDAPSDCPHHNDYCHWIPCRSWRWN